MQLNLKALSLVAGIFTAAAIWIVKQPAVRGKIRPPADRKPESIETDA